MFVCSKPKIWGCLHLCWVSYSNFDGLNLENIARSWQWKNYQNNCWGIEYACIIDSRMFRLSMPADSKRSKQKCCYRSKYPFIFHIVRYWLSFRKKILSDQISLLESIHNPHRITFNISFVYHDICTQQQQTRIYYYLFCYRKDWLSKTRYTSQHK